MKRKLNLKKIKVVNLTKPVLNKEKMNNINGGGESNFTTVPIVTIGGTLFTYNTLTSCTYNNADTYCVAS